MFSPAADVSKEEVLVMMERPFLSLDLAVAPNPPSLIPNLKLMTVPIDAYTCFELWVPSGKHDKLMFEEVLLLKDDYLRLEEICGKLMWLLGGRLISRGNTYSQELIYDWRSLVKLLRQGGKPFDTVVVNYAPATILPITSEGNNLQGWGMNPATWSISFVEFVPTEQNYEVKTLPLSLSITCGQPSTRYVEATSIGMRYL